MNGLEAEVASVVTDHATDDSGMDAGVPSGRELRQFARSVVNPSESTTSLDTARRHLFNAEGRAALADAAGIVAFFDAINRIADGTGTELEEPLAANAALLLDGVDLEAMRSE
jgi:predicted RNA-binding Zn ribbon-like protein